MAEFLNRKTVLETIRQNAMLRVQDIYDAVASLPVTVVQGTETTNTYNILYEEGDNA